MIWSPRWFPGTNLQDINLDWILKKVSALRGGSTGQYLYKKSDKDFDFGWKTGGGGGGGTSDYLDLDNKPTINNVELIGNKTAADLGLAASSDIPEIPVQSVNGKTGVVVLSASDVGAYVKPSTGIPKTDLSSAVQESLDKADTAYSKPSTGIPKTDLSGAVQTSLDKADTALQSVPSTYRTAAAQDVIDAAQNSNLAAIESSPATAAHAVGEYIVYNGQLYKVTAAIAPSETLTPGTNISAVSAGGLNDLKSAVDSKFGVVSAVPIVSGDDLNNYVQPGYYRTGGTLPANAPTGSTWAILQVLIVGTTYMQFLYKADYMYMRTGNSTTWYNWYRYSGTQV